jgi:deazaflavin-dependent oxidoreductase (nitroreductase family)
MTGNDFVTFFLRSPLHVFMGDTLLITVTGRKTGRSYSTPVGFYREGSCLWVMTRRDRAWWRNVQNGARVSLLLGGRTIRAFAETELDPKAVEERLIQYIHHVPMAARSLGMRTHRNAPDPEEIAQIAKDRLFVKIRPDTGG